jgi:hypothetical protein
VLFLLRVRGGRRFGLLNVKALPLLIAIFVQSSQIAREPE